MAKRTTNISVQREFVPEQEIRTSTISLQVEYTYARKIRAGVVAIMIEYIPVSTSNSVHGPKLQSS